MMVRFHISRDGVARKCQAKTVASCRAVKKDMTEHFDTREEAQQAYEQRMVSQTFGKVEKNGSNSPKSSNSSSDMSMFLKPLVITPSGDVSVFRERLSDYQRLMPLESLSASVRPEVYEYVGSFMKGEVPEKFPLQLSSGYGVGMFMSHMQAQDSGYFAKITKVFAKNLKNKMIEDLDGKEPVVLDPMAGKGYFVKAMREQGVKTIGSDDKSWQKYQTDEGIENLDAVKSLKKYGKDITHLMVSWAPMDTGIDKRLYDIVKEDYSHITIINIGEDMGGCTGTEKFWVNVRKDEKQGITSVEYDNCGYISDAGLNDFVTFVKFNK